MPDDTIYMTPRTENEGVIYMEPLAALTGVIYMYPLEPEYPPTYMEIELPQTQFESPYYGRHYTIALDPGMYQIVPSGGGCDDEAGTNSWTWHLRTSCGDINGGYSMENTVPAGPYAASAAAAFASVTGSSLTFNWGGGTFEMWIPSNDAAGDNNSGSLSVILRST